MSQPDLIVYGPDSVTRSLVGPDGGSAHIAGTVTAVHDGDTLDIGSISVQAFEGEHAAIHPAIPVPHNIGFHVSGRVFHPGGSFWVPPHGVDTLLVPVSGPWVILGEAMAFVESVKPKRSILIHDAMLSEIGLSSAVSFLGESGITGTPALRLAEGESFEV